MIGLRLSDTKFRQVTRYYNALNNLYREIEKGSYDGKFNFV